MATDGNPNNESSYEIHNKVYGNFLVAAYRRPEFRVDATLSAVTAIAGTTLKGVVTGRYLFGAAMTGRPVTWNLTRSASTWAAITGIRKKFVDERFTFLSCCGGDNGGIATKAATLDAKGTHTIEAGRRRPASACPTPTRSKVKSRICRVRRSPDAPRSSSTPRPGTSACSRPRRSSISGRASKRQ